MAIRKGWVRRAVLDGVVIGVIVVILELLLLRVW